MKRKIKQTIEFDAVTISEAWEEYMLEKSATNLAPSTIREYNLKFKSFMRDEEIDWEDYTTELSQQHVFHWINTKKQETRIVTVNANLKMIKAFLMWCMEDCRKYIFPSYSIPMLRMQEEQLKLFTEDDLELLLEHPRKTDSYVQWRTYAVVNWVLGTGNRISTITDVRIGDIDFRAKEIQLHHTKNKRAQIIPLSTSLSTVIKEFIRIWRRDAAPDDYLFANIGDEQATTTALRAGFVRYCEERGVKRHNIHGLRHNFAKAWVKNNGNVFTLQKVLGHSTLDMTRRYVRLFSEDIKDDYDKFSALDSLKKSKSRTQKISRDDF